MAFTEITCINIMVIFDLYSIHLYLHQVNVFFKKLLVLGIKYIIPQIFDQFFTLKCLLKMKSPEIKDIFFSIVSYLACWQENKIFISFCTKERMARDMFNIGAFACARIQKFLILHVFCQRCEVASCKFSVQICSGPSWKKSQKICFGIYSRL